MWESPIRRSPQSLGSKSSGPGSAPGYSSASSGACLSSARRQKVAELCRARAKRRRDERLRARRIGLFGGGGGAAETNFDWIRSTLQEEFGWESDVNVEELENLEKELVLELMMEEEEHWRRMEAEAQEREIDHYATEMMETTESMVIPCPICGAQAMRETEIDAGCCGKCGLRLERRQGCETLEQLAERLGSAFSDHGSRCSQTPRFEVRQGVLVLHCNICATIVCLC